MTWKKPWHKREHGKALGGMRGLSLELKGAYNVLLDYMYDQGGPVPLDERRLCGELECDVRVFKRVIGELIAAEKIRLWSDGSRVWVVNDKVVEVVGAEGFEASTSAELTAEVRDKFAIAIKQLSPTSSKKPKQNNAPEKVSEPKNAPRDKKEERREPPIVPQGDQPALLLVPDEPIEPHTDDVRTAFDGWNALARRLALPIAEDLTDTRRRAIAKRIERGGLLQWGRALKAVEASAFCQGQTKPRREGDKPFRATLDFVCQASSFQKLIEGNFGQDAKSVAPPAASQPPIDPNDHWRRKVANYRTGSGYWNTNDWGAEPGRNGCSVPPTVLKEFNIVAPQPKLAAMAGE